MSEKLVDASTISIPIDIKKKENPHECELEQKIRWQSVPAVSDFDSERIREFRIFYDELPGRPQPYNRSLQPLRVRVL